MHRIYFTAVPLQSNFVLQKMPVHAKNFSFTHTPKDAAFPIVPIMADTMQEGDIATVIAVRQKNKDFNENMQMLQQEVKALALPICQIREVVVDEGQDGDLLISLFQQMIAMLENDACYYACMTFGTKSYPVVLFSVLSYAEKMFPSVEVKGIYYRELLRDNTCVVQSQTYDMTALFRLNAIVDQLASMGGQNKKQVIETLLKQGEEPKDGE